MEPSRASRFTDAQKGFILKQGAEGILVAEICRNAGISAVTNFNWRMKYVGLMPPAMPRLKQLDKEN